MNFNNDKLEDGVFFESSDVWAENTYLVEEGFGDGVVLSPEIAAEVDKKIEAARIVYDVLSGVDRPDMVKDFGASLENSVLRGCSLDGRLIGVGVGEGDSISLNEYLFQLWQFKSEMLAEPTKDVGFGRHIEDYILMLLTTVDFNKYREYMIKRNVYVGKESRVFDWNERNIVDMGIFDTAGGSADFTTVDTVEFVARRLFEEGRQVTYGSISDNSVDNIGDEYDSVFLTECLAKGLGRVSTKMVAYDQRKTLQAVEKLFGDSWAQILKSGVLVDWDILFDKYVEWKKELGFFSFKKFLRRMGVLRKLKIHEQTKAVQEVFPWIKSEELKSRRFVHPSLVRTVETDSEEAGFDLYSYDYDYNYDRDNQQGPVGVDVGFVEQIDRRANLDKEKVLEYFTTRRKKRTVRRKPGRPKKLNTNNVTGASIYNVDYFNLMEQNELQNVMFGHDVIDGLLDKLEAIDDSDELL